MKSDYDPVDDCSVIKPASTTYIDSDGNPVPEPSADVATVEHYALGPGDNIESITPPVNFNPLTASSEWMSLLGYEPAPADPAEYDQWAKQFEGWKRAESSHSMCVTDRSSTTYTSSNWSGVMATGYSDYRRAHGAARVPTFAASCAAASDMTLWSGIGGWNGQPLIQNGFDSHQSQLQGMNAWWEVLNNAYDTKMVVQTSNFAAAQEIVRSNTYYNISNDTVTFTWFNVTTGVTAPSVVVSSVDHGEIAMDAFYSGQTAEWIDERATKSDGSLYYLRNFGSAGWEDVQVARAGQPDQYFGMYPHVGIDMYAGSTPLSDLSGGRTTAPANWTMHWDACG